MPHFRPLILSDLPEVLRIQLSAYPPMLHEPSETFVEKLSSFPRGAIGCFDDGLRAYVFCHPWTLGEIVPLSAVSLELPERPTCMYIHDLAVASSSRGRGLAARLMDEVFNLAGSMHLSACGLVAVQGSEGFWERFGFTKHHKLEYRPGVRAYYMIRGDPPRTKYPSPTSPPGQIVNGPKTAKISNPFLD